MKILNRIDTWISDLLDRTDLRDWCCRHRWCFRECTYQYRCHLHQDDE